MFESLHKVRQRAGRHLSTCQRSAARACEGSRFSCFLVHPLGISFAGHWLAPSLRSSPPDKAVVALHAGSLTAQQSSQTAETPVACRH